MQHLEHERLVFLALGESEADDGERTHLDTCAHCRTELSALRQVAGLGAETQGLGDLPDPPEHIWQGIEADIRAAEGTEVHAPVAVLTDVDRQQVPGQTRGTETGSVTRLDPTRRPRRGRGWSRWAATAVTAVAAAAVGVAGTVTVLRPTDPTPAETPTVLASAPLAAFGSTPKSAQGDARVLQGGQLHLHVANLPSVPGYYEVWLINPTTMEMFSVGTLGSGSDALLPLPPNVDLTSYSVVDVSAEQYDNNTRHSGDSLLRGTLTG
ncbi:anti-sigma factor [Micromonospora chokoriensis]|uniref:Anti-sigma-K factor rskA n=1 Tax=Micromonospora chokoriensis TaxID=356851 RepID=A0A1C4ZEB8_9ACTN|nr:anti-sigma factor [Micromonospora chokoriensis]SCF31224.1 Anti-sigma-K factor rskA [Micromonospora chokoriensis]